MGFEIISRNFLNFSAQDPIKKAEIGPKVPPHVHPLPHQDVATVVTEVEVVGPEVQVKGPLTSISGGNGSTHPHQPEVRQMTVPTEVHGTEDRQDADAVFRIHRETIDEAAEVVDNFRLKPEIKPRLPEVQPPKPDMKPLSRK